MSALQIFEDDYLERCKALSAQQIISFLDDFRQIHSPARKIETKLISIKIEADLLAVFKTRARLDGVQYQTRIKKIMRDWLVREG